MPAFQSLSPADPYRGAAAARGVYGGLCCTLVPWRCPQPLLCVPCTGLSSGSTAAPFPKPYLILSFKVVSAPPRSCCLGRVGCVSFPPLTSASLPSFPLWDQSERRRCQLGSALTARAPGVPMSPPALPALAKHHWVVGERSPLPASRCQHRAPAPCM